MRVKYSVKRIASSTGVLSHEALEVATMTAVLWSFPVGDGDMTLV